MLMIPRWFVTRVCLINPVIIAALIAVGNMIAVQAFAQETSVTTDPVTQLYPDLPPQAEAQSEDTLTSDTDEQVNRRFSAVREVWLREKDPEKREVLERELYGTGKSLQDDFSERVFQELGLGRSLEEAARDLPTTSILVSLKNVQVLDGITNKPSWHNSSVFRRVGTGHVEAWTTTTGYLVDKTGSIVHKATVPRRDGQGREWFGAFLPNGMWATTDLWSKDRQLHVYNSKGRHVRSFPMPCTVAWARADTTGKSWIARAWSTDDTGDCGGEFFRVTPGGDISSLGSKFPSQLLPRDVGPMMIDFVLRHLQSDDRSHVLHRFTQSHGFGSMWGNFYLGKSGIVNHSPFDSPGASKEEIYTLRVYGDTNYGFWPGELAAWIETPGGTWMVDSAGKVEAVFPGSVIADAADGKSLLLLGPGGVVHSITPDLAVASSRAFTTGSYGQAHPLFLDDELQIGFFSVNDGSEVVIARW